MTVKISEIFHSLQGEGGLAGSAAVFIRLSGCPLRCRWCDSQYAWQEEAGSDYSFEQIKNFIISQPPCGHIVVTGGEPMINPAIVELTEFLSQSGMHITIETAGIKYIGGLKCDLMSISPKLSNSTPSSAKNEAFAIKHEQNRLKIGQIRELMKSYDYQLKFVVDSKEDIAEIASIVEKLAPDADKVMLMPQARSVLEYTSKAQFVAEACKNSGFRFSPRLHITLWQGVRGK